MMVRRDFPGTYTTQEVADIIGRSKSTVQRWRREERLLPSVYAESGQTTIWLYTEDDLERAKQLSKSIKTGRPKGD